jgi:asparagine synthase (glutamine-hydrolysing)
VYRYIALIWNPADAEKSASAHSLIERLRTAGTSWQRALDVPGVAVFQAGLNEGSSEARLLDGNAGVVLGRIFARDMASPAMRPRFDAAETAAIVATGGTRLFQHYWGRYAAIVRNASTGEACVLRDPLGQMPCMLTSYRGVSVLFSDLEDCLSLWEFRFTVNWSYVTGLLANSGMMTRATALNEVSEITLGERVRFSGDTVQRSLEWHPFDIARTDQIVDVEEAARVLQATTRSCIHAWASCYSGLIHNLSGGLDSSIVLACLKDAPTHPAVTCLNYYGTGPSEDERQFARMVAQHLGAELIESRLDPADVRLERITAVRRSARPWYYMYELEHGELERHLAAEKGADGLFSGSGGDGIFYQARAELAVADYFFDHGWGSGLLQTAVEAAQMSRKSIWPLLANAVKARLLPKPFNPRVQRERPERTLVSKDLLRDAARNAEFEHPWFTRKATRGVPPGILWHVSTVSVPPAYYTSFGPERFPERTMPLLSQPLVEVCLRMPSYLLIRSGRDRAIARKAFAADLPEGTVKRTAKGRVDQYVRNIVDANRKFLRELLLDGVLVRRGLLDRETLELYLTKERSPADSQYSAILHEHLCIEAWLRRALELSAPVGQTIPSVTTACESTD